MCLCDVPAYSSLDKYPGVGQLGHINNCVLRNFNTGFYSGWTSLYCHRQCIGALFHPQLPQHLLFVFLMTTLLNVVLIFILLMAIKDFVCLSAITVASFKNVLV